MLNSYSNNVKSFAANLVARKRIFFKFLPGIDNICHNHKQSGIQIYRRAEPSTFLLEGKLCLHGLVRIFHLPRNLVYWEVLSILVVNQF